MHLYLQTLIHLCYVHLYIKIIFFIIHKNITNVLFNSLSLEIKIKIFNLLICFCEIDIKRRSISTLHHSSLFSHTVIFLACNSELVCVSKI